MRFALVGPTNEENLALGYLTAALRAAGHLADSVAFDGSGDVQTAARRTLDVRPQAVGLSIAFQAGASGFLALARALRAHGFAGHVVAGGQFASLAADTLLHESPALDAVLRGEADESIVSLASALQHGTPLLEVPGIVLREGAAVRCGPRPAKPLVLDALPFPVRETSAPSCAGIPTASLVASRGCRARCSFCSIAAFGALADGPARRERSPRSVARELALLWRERGTRFFVFQDDDFLGGGTAANLERLASLETAFADEGLPPVALAIKARPDGIDAGVVAVLRRVGLALVFLGVETASARGLSALARAVTPDRVRRALATLHAADVFVASNLMLWHPDGTLDDLRENVDLLASFPDQLFNFGRTEPYEGAPLTLRLAREGRLLGDWRNRDYRVDDPGARLALEVFAATLAARCRSDGAIPLAQRAGTAAAAASRLLDPARVAPLARRARAAIRRLAASNRSLLAGIVEFAASGDTARAGTAARLRRDMTGTDATLVPDLRELLVRLEELVVSTPTARRSPWRSGARLAAVAAAGALACSQPQAPIGHPSPSEAGTSRSGLSGPESNVLAGLDVELNTDQRFIPGGPCSPPTFLPSAVAATIAADPAAGRIEAIDVRGGTLDRALVAPDGSRAVASLAAGPDTGEGELLVQVRRTDGTAAVLARMFFWAGGYAFATDDERQQFLAPPPPPYHGFMGCDPPGPMPVMPFTPTEFFAEDGRVSFAMRYGRPVGWAFDLGFAAGVAGSEGATVEPLPATCEFGRLDVGVPVEHESMPPGWFACTFSPYDPEGVTYLREGSFNCTVSFRVRLDDGDEETVSGALPVHVAPDGTVTLGNPAADAPAAD